ncbi:DUF6973 domain-containing protein [Polaribacter cellanae]|uniref:DUF6973 domain-containing protein n=1 Tax=Polaribacter cellanae TaxID=2818493 RepID=A0A975H623_9FLAO|nr:hypothetical protein [Polaribacter cellanae]QTE21538.1 hypothetical protein J3359_11970 [Polaribacter cellanae]
MKKSLPIIFFTFVISTNAQSDFKRFFKLSGPIKTWVLFHPFKAKKSLKISMETNRVADSIRKTNLLDGDPAGGQVDAFRHAYWMARLRQELGKSSARSLGKAHERDNYITYKKRKLEDGVLPDEISSEMDLYNNEEGLKLIRKNSEVSKNGLIFRIVNAIHAGKMKIIKKDKNGNFLTCDGKIIPKESLKGKWKNNKCLISSKSINRLSNYLK